jgi:hypothetical protein
MGAENGKFETFLRFELRLHDIIVCSLNPLKVRLFLAITLS